MSVAEEVFGGGGLLSETFDNYHPRKGQYALVEAIESAFDRRQHLIGEAPVGVGKSLAYLVPAVMMSKIESRTNMIDRLATGESEDGEPVDTVGKEGRIIVVTGNIALQEQLIKKDLPFLQGILPKNFTFALAKGMSNYVCKRKAGITENDNAWKKKLSPIEVAQMEDMIAWSQTTKTGDRSDLDFEPSGRAWTLLSTTSDDCAGGDCEVLKAKACFPRNAKDQYRSANVIVCNYALFLLHLKLLKETGKYMILPEANKVVMDEAHLLPKIARDHLGFDVTYFTFMKLAQTVGFASSYVPSHQMGDCHAVSNDLQNAAKEFFKNLTAYKRKFKDSPRVNVKKAVDIAPLMVHLQDAYNLLMAALVGLDKGSGTVKSLKIYDQNDMESSGTARTSIRLTQGAERVRELMTNLQSFRDLSDPNMCLYVEEPPGDGLDYESKLCGRMIDVSEFLNEQLFEKTPSVVMVSGTLSVAGAFDHFIAEVGVQSPQKIIVDSPFDYLQNAALVLPEDIHDPTDPQAHLMNAELIRKIVMGAKGRTLCLFTSYKGLKAAQEELRGIPYKVLVQGTAPRSLLVKQFKEDTSSVLLGTESFWAGIDVPGETCSVVVIDKLPFPHFLDPMADAIKAKFGESFKRYQMPHAVTQFRQGFGRLIRTESDRGVCVVLDNRLRKKGYGRAFINSLPKMAIGNELSDVNEFLGT